MQKLVFTVLAAIFAFATPGHLPAAFVLTLSQVGGNVVLNGSGTLNLTALNPDGTGTYEAFISPNPAGLYAGPTSATAIAFYAGLSGPASFGTSGQKFASSGSGSLVGFYASSTDLIVPAGYVSGTALTATNTYTSQTFASLGFTPGTYTYTWGTGATADSLTVTSIVPEPSTWGLLSLGAVGAGVVALRRRRVAV